MKFLKIINQPLSEFYACKKIIIKKNVDIYSDSFGTASARGFIPKTLKMALVALGLMLSIKKVVLKSELVSPVSV